MRESSQVFGLQTIVLRGKKKTDNQMKQGVVHYVNGTMR